MGRQVQQWLQELDVTWWFHISYNPQGAGIIESYNGLLKRGLKLESGSLHGWSQRLWTVLRQLNERLLMGAVAPVDALLKLSAAPIQLQVQTTHESLKPGFGTQNNILLLAPQAIQIDTKRWAWPWAFCVTDRQWIDVVAPWGTGPMQASSVSHASYPSGLRDSQ